MIEEHLGTQRQKTLEGRNQHLCARACLYNRERTCFQQRRRLLPCIIPLLSRRGSLVCSLGCPAKQGSEQVRENEERHIPLTFSLN